MKNMDRRHFLRCTAAGSAGLLFPLSLLGKQRNSTLLDSNEADMEVRVLGNTGIKLPILSMGVMRADNPNLVKAALRSGIVHFDTANGYQSGNNEQMLGKVFKDVPRSSFVLATKVKPSFGDNVAGLFLEKFNESMARLGLEYVDILYLHALSKEEEVLNEPLLNVLKELKEKGVIKHAGVSTHSNEPAVIDAVVKSKFLEVVLTSYNFRQKNVDDVKASIARAASAGIGVVAMKTMAGAKDVNIPAALKWALQDKNVTTAIPGFTNFDEMDVCLNAAVDINYTSDEKAFLAQADAIPTLYCQQCKQCESQCLQHLPIPDLMRAYMYNYGYHHAALAKETIAELQLPANPCASCSVCKVHCVSGFAVAEKVKDIARIAAVPGEFLA